MSGVEAITAISCIQLIDACIGITKTIVDTGRAAYDAQGLPPKLRDLIETLPAIEDLLDIAREKCENEEVAEDASKSAHPILKQCEDALGELRDIFRKACPKDGENRSKRVWRGTRTVFFGRDSRVKELLGTILRNLRLLEQKEIYAIGDKLGALERITEALVDDDGSKYTHHGAGSIFANEGGHQENYVGGGSNNRQINKPGVYHEGPTTYNHHTHLPPGDWNIGLNSSDREKHRNEFMQSLYRSACTYKDKKNRNRQRTPGTCEWFTNHPLFKRWASTTADHGPDLLYVTADPGCGKSVLSRYLIDEVLPLDNRIVCYFFFKDDFEDQKSCLRAICTVLHQLFATKFNLLTDTILDEFEARGERFLESFTDLWSIFVSAAAQQDTICVFDALDECSKDDRALLLDEVTSLHATQPSRVSNKGIRCLLTSRPYDHILRQLRQRSDSEMELIHLQGDQGEVAEEIVAEIRLVVDSRIKEVARCLQLSPEEEKWLRARLESIPNRTYLWITLIFDGLIHIETGVSKATVLRMLETPPSTVYDAYEKILNRTQERESAKVALHSVLAAKRPLSLAEMSHVLAFQACQSAGQAYDNAFDFIVPRERFRSYLRDLCGMFVVVVDEKVYLLHQTAREFLLYIEKLGPQRGRDDEQVFLWKHSMDLVESNSILARICARYLLSYFAREDTLFPEYCASLEDSAFLEYSSGYWTEHYQQSSAENRSQLAKEARDLYSSYKTYKQWRMIYNKHFQYFGYILPTGKSPLCTAAYFGLDGGVQLLLAENGYNLLNGRYKVSSKDSGNRFGKANVAGTLLAAYVNAEDALSGTPLWCAVTRQHEAVVKLLLDTGKADVNVRNSAGQTMLSKTAEEGHEAIVKLLLDKGKVDVNAKDARSSQTPLFRAAERGHEVVVKLLLDTGKVDVNAQDVWGQTPLLCAAYSGHEAVVKLLLDAGKGKINVDAMDKDGRTPLLNAAEDGHEVVVKLLLDTGKVDVHIKDHWGHSPLLCARDRGHKGVVKLLENYVLRSS